MEATSQPDVIELHDDEEDEEVEDAGPSGAAEDAASVCQLDCCEYIRASFTDHCAHLREARRRRRSELAVRTVVPPPSRESVVVDGDAAGSGVGTSASAANPNTTTGPIVSSTALGAVLDSDKYEGDCVLRTLHQLLAMIDDRGFARSPQQCQFHDAFIRASSRVMYRQDWSKSKPMIMEHNHWKDCPSQILVSTPRRFGKTFS
jgi:hypothetical protein